MVDVLILVLVVDSKLCALRYKTRNFGNFSFDDRSTAGLLGLCLPDDPALLESVGRGKKA